MSSHFNLTISTPERQFFAGEVESVMLASIDGLIGVLPGHLSMVVALDTAPIRIKVKGKEEMLVAALSGGFARIKGDTVIIMADTAEWPEEIEVNRVLDAQKRAQERLQAHVSEVEYMQSQVALKRAFTRLNVVNIINEK